MEKIIQLVSKYLLIPLFLKAFKALEEWWNKKQKYKKIDEETKKKVDDFNSNPNDGTFSKLP